jgi:large subunit ribosomal protein L9
MKIILIDEVQGLGEPGKIVDVAPGYARNFLVPRKLAVYASSRSAKELEHNKRVLERKRMRLQTAAMSTAEKLNELTLTIEAHSGDRGRLFGAVTNIDIADALQQKYGITVDRRKMHLASPIHTTGLHEVEIRLMGDTKALLKVQVVDPTHPDQPAEAPVAAPAAVKEPSTSVEESPEA